MKRSQVEKYFVVGHWMCFGLNHKLIFDCYQQIVYYCTICCVLCYSDVIEEPVVMILRVRSTYLRLQQVPCPNEFFEVPFTRLPPKNARKYREAIVEILSKVFIASIYRDKLIIFSMKDYYKWTGKKPAAFPLQISRASFKISLFHTKMISGMLHLDYFFTHFFAFIF